MKVQGENVGKLGFTRDIKGRDELFKQQIKTASSVATLVSQRCDTLCCWLASEPCIVYRINMQHIHNIKGSKLHILVMRDV